MVGLLTVDGHGGQANIVPFGPVFESVKVAVPDALRQLRPAARFMWLGWTKARTLRFQPSASGGVFVGEHDSFAPVTHRRRVVFHGEVDSPNDHTARGEPLPSTT